MKRKTYRYVKKVFELRNSESVSIKYQSASLESIDLTREVGPSLASFVTKDSLLILEMLSHNNEWMLLGPQTWHLLTHFRKFENFIKKH